jgi:hypothetical protein
VNEITRASLNLLVPEQRTHPPLDDKAVLILVVVTVQRGREGVGRHRVLYQREAIFGFETIDHEADSDAAQKTSLSVPGPDDLRCGNAHGVSFR